MKKSRSRKEYTEMNLCQKIKPRRVRVTAQQNNIVAINLLIFPKTGAQTFDVKPSRVVNVSRRGTERGKSGSEKVLRIRRTVTSKKRGGIGPRAPFIVRRQAGGWTTPGKQTFTRPFHPLPRVPRIRSLPPRFDTVLKSYSHRRPTCPSSFHHCQPAPLPSRKILFLLPQRAALIFRQWG